MKKSYILIILFVIFIVIITVVGSIIVTGNVKIDEKKDILVVQNNKEVYFNCYGYSVDNPNIIVNPYGNSPLTAVVMFETDDYSEVSVFIKSKSGNSDINYTFSKDKYHYIPIYGLYADYDNIVVIRSEGKEKVINIKTDKLPLDFEMANFESNDNFRFYNSNYPYAVDVDNEIRWFLSDDYYGNITILDNSNIIIGSDKYTEDGNTISLYRMNLLGKIYNEYLVEDNYYGFNTIYEDNILILSDKLLLIDLQTGEIVQEYIQNNGYDYLGVAEDKIIVGKDNVYYSVEKEDINEYSYTVENINYNFYNNTSNYKIVPSIRLGKLKETNVNSEKVSLIKYDKYNGNDIVIEKDNNRIKILNENEDKIYVILDKFLDKRIYEVGYIKYINTIGLSGKYTVYYMIDDKVYKTNYYVEV